MSHQGVLSAKQQEAAFGQILKKPFNLRCADCSSKSPTWASLDFGVFVCYNCSGAHRMLGMNVTRIRSTKLDCWTQENIDMMDALGNDLNDYWESRIPKNSKITPSATPEEIRAFVQEKYVKRIWVKQGQADPKTRYNQCLLSGVPFRVNQSNTFFSENGERTQQQTVKDPVKQFHSTQLQWGFERKDRQLSVDNRQKEVNLLAHDQDFDWATATNHFNTVSGVPNREQEANNGTSPLFKPKQNNLADFDLLGSQNSQKLPTPQQFNTYNPTQGFNVQQTQKPQQQQFNSYNPANKNDFTFQQQVVSQNSQQNNLSNKNDFGFQQQVATQSQQAPNSYNQLVNQQPQNNNNAFQQQITQNSQPQNQYNNNAFQQQASTQNSYNYSNNSSQQQAAAQNQLAQQSNNQFQQQFGTQNSQYNNTYQQQAMTQNSQPQNQYNNAYQVNSYTSQQQVAKDFPSFGFPQPNTKPPLPKPPQINQKYQNNPFVKDMQDIMNLYSAQQPNKYDHLRNNPFM